MDTRGDATVLTDYVLTMTYAFLLPNQPSHSSKKNNLNGPCLLDNLILKLRLPVVLYVSFAVDP